jgi:hypothetical protein
MQTSWWQYRKWRFMADMNGDGAVSTADVPHWMEWIFLLPGDAAIALSGATPVGRFLELTPASFGSPTSAGLAAALWVLIIMAAFYLPRFFVDIIDPTSRQQRLEHRRAERMRKRRARLARRKPLHLYFRRPAPLRYEERREPRF